MSLKKPLFYILITLLLNVNLYAQSYFPPINSNVWQTVSPTSLGWNMQYVDSLYSYLDKVKSKSFMVLVNGNIVLEKYFNGATPDSFRYWASAGKTLTGFCIGVCESQGLLKLTDSSSKFLGTAWSSLTPLQEKNITIKNQLTMTTGLIEFTNPDCTLPSCLKYLAPAGQRWAYHNAPYTLLDKVIENASGKTLNKFVADNITVKTGITGQYVKIGDNSVFISKPRSFARFGLLLLNKGFWNGQNIIGDSTYLTKSVATQNPQNASYGYLTWLNGKASYMAPGYRNIFNGFLTPSAPPDAYFALGKNWQALQVIPSLNMVIARMGDNPEPDSAISVSIIPNEIVWQWMRKILPNSNTKTIKHHFNIQQNTDSKTLLINEFNIENIQIYALTGAVLVKTIGNKIAYNNLKPGIYLLAATLKNGQKLAKQVCL